MHPTRVRDYDPPADTAWAAALLGRSLAGRQQARRGELIDALTNSGLVALDGSTRIGLLTYQVIGAECEVVALVAERRRQGVGTVLLDALKSRLAGCRRVWLVTTNDNLDALRFYQRRGFCLSGLRPGAVDDARRRLKPGIPLLGAYSIPLRDELELELLPASGRRNPDHQKGP
jgi:ribosomal protein S18 acetylase RimI-like enzyme